MADIDWNLSRVFLAALAESSLSGAARVLGVPQPTVSRQITQFEKQLGVALFTRSPRGLKPTPEAVRFDLPLWLALHEDQRRTPRVRLLFDHLASGLARYLSQAVHV